MESLGAFNLVGLTLLGTATLVATSLVYGPARRGSTDMLRRILSSAGWILIACGLIGGVTGLTHLASIPLVLITVFVLAMSIRLFRRHEHSLRLWQIAIAADRGIPLLATLRAMEREQAPLTAWKSRVQADSVAGGRTLAQALADSYDTPARGPALAVAAAADWGSFAPALREALRTDEEFEYMVRDELGRLFYVYVVLLQLFLVLAFLIIKILPVFSGMMFEFGVENSAANAQVADAALWISERWWLLLPLLPILLALLIAALLHFLDLWPGRMPGFSWFTGAIDRAWVMRGLAWGVRAERPIPEILESLARHYRVARVRWKLDEALGYVRQGVPWIDSLHRAGLLRSSDAAVLRAAERTGNVEWALREQADGSSRRWGVGLKRLLTILFPVAMVALGLLVGQVGWYCLAMISTLIESLS